eukprot:g19697.t1
MHVMTCDLLADTLTAFAHAPSPRATPERPARSSVHGLGEAPVSPECPLILSLGLVKPEQPLALVPVKPERSLTLSLTPAIP